MHLLRRNVTHFRVILTEINFRFGSKLSCIPESPEMKSNEHIIIITIDSCVNVLVQVYACTHVHNYYFNHTVSQCEISFHIDFFLGEMKLDFKGCLTLKMI